MLLLQTIASLGAALSDPTRAAILLLAREQADITVGGIAETLGYTVGGVSRHLAILERVGLVERRRSGRRTLVRARADRLARITDAFIACRGSASSSPPSSTGHAE